MSDSKPYTILIVDDTPANIDLLIGVLEDDYKILVAISGAEVLERVRKEMPDLILLDVMMPGISGYETCRRLKENRATSKIPVIFVTALSDTGDKAQGFEVGAVDYISKPFDVLDIRAKIKTHLAGVAPLSDNHNTEVDESIKHAQFSSVSEVEDQKHPATDTESQDASRELSGALPGLDLDRGLKTLDGNVSLYRKLLAGFLRDFADATERVKTSLAEDDCQGAHLIAHTVKGLAGNFGAFHLQKAATLLEQAIIEKDNSSLDKLLTDFSDQLYRVMASIKALPAATGSEEEPTKIKDIDHIINRVLIVDDTPLNVSIIENFIKSDFAIKTATSGPDALEIIQSDWRPDLILLDIVMPGMDGIEVCEKIRQEPDVKEIPIIFVTANTEDEVLARAFKAGGNDYIRKPVNKVELATRIKAIFDQKKLAEARWAEEKLTGAMAMAGAVCHEMGQPLQAILTCAEILLLNFDQEDEQHDLAEMIAEQSKSMAVITKKLQKITSYSTKKYLGDTTIIDLDKSSSQ